ncbi:MAG: GlxA family transcriptional regulator [Actinomycetia bacterium]|nr:GlxA family transcriptional regulator [Actinomycetes bacterium]
MKPAQTSKRVVIVVFEQLQLLDLAGPVEVLSLAGFIDARAAYEHVLASPDGRGVTSSSGVRLAVDTSLADEVASRAPLHTLVVVGGPGTEMAAADPAVTEAVAELAARASRVASVCTGAMVLAAAGLLDGRTVTTHWAMCDTLARRHPGLDVDDDKIFVQHDDVWTSAGVTAGIDLTLALVAEDHGDHLAQEIAGWLVVFSRRPGGQSQFSATLQAQSVQSPAFAELLAWLPGNLDADLGVAALAERCHMSPRTFARNFGREVGTTPAAHIERLRVETARTLLATSDLGIDTIARRVGYRRVETLHRAFRRTVGTTPDRYRQHFSRQPA